MTTHSKELALNSREYELLLEGCRRIQKDRQSTQARFAVFIAGRLGFRAGELIHLEEDWVNWRKRRIEIPVKERCTKGKEPNRICGYCEQAARQMVEYNSIDLPEARLRLLEDGEIQGFRPSTERELIVAHRRHLDGDIATAELDDRIHTILESSQSPEWSIYEGLVDEAEALVTEKDLTIDEARRMMWKPKTDAASREVPFDWSSRVEICIERFFQDYDRWPVSKSALTRRVQKALRMAEELDEDSTHLHGLRSTAASYHASRGMDTLPLQQLFGWASPATARNYVSSSPSNTQRELHNIHSG